MGNDEEMKKTVKDWFSGLEAISMIQAYRNLSHNMTSASIFMGIM
jgi:hypothetical protein